MVEPKYPGVVERYVNMGDCYDKEALWLLPAGLPVPGRGGGDF